MLESPHNLNREFEALFNNVSSLPKQELRGSRLPLPDDVFLYLNEIQRIALNSLESFGWTLAFIRRPQFMTPLIVVKNDEATRFAVIEEDGSVNMTPQVKWRH